MATTDALAKITAVIGTILVWFPTLAPIALSLRTLMPWRPERIFRFDYLMPAELFPVALVGGGLLLWAARRARSRRGLIGWGLGLAALMLVAGQTLAVVTGLASGEIEPAGWPWALVLASLGAFWLLLAAAGVGAVLLVRDLFR